MSELFTKWRRRTDQLREAGATDAARLVDGFLDDFEELLREIDEGTVNLTEASEIGGYHADTLGRMVRRGDLVNVGRRHAPRLRLRDVPVKPGRPSAPEALVGRWIRQQGLGRTA